MKEQKPVNNLWPTNGMLEGAVLQMLQDGDGAYFTVEIASRLRAPYAAVRNTLHRLKTAGKVKQKSSGTANNQSIWWVVKSEVKSCQE
jgi:hypothetical protein